ncbi:MAG: AraC family transcriptional regulator [Planctomycetota bacterium]
MIRQFLNQLSSPFTGEELFDHLADVVFFIKDSNGKYLVVNETLAERCGVRDKQELIGCTASEVLSPPLGERFSDQDRKVLHTGQPLLSQLELHLYETGQAGWCLTTKLPLRKRGGTIAGIVGVSQDLRLPDLKVEEYIHVAAAIKYAEQNIASPPSVADLAQVAGMSRYQLDRRVRRVFGLTTGQWLIKSRIDLAQRRLVETDDTIAMIALGTGYADQSAFTRQFRRATGLTPSEYRGARHEHG